MVKKWKLPPKIKIYEALGCLGDRRIIVLGNQARVRSSSGRKWYDVTYDPKRQAIMSNDNGSYWQGYLGYPAITFLLQKRIIKHSALYSRSLAHIPWKEINRQFKNDYGKTEAAAVGLAEERGVSKDDLVAEVNSVYKQIGELSLNVLGKRVKPPPED